MDTHFEVVKKHIPTLFIQYQSNNTIPHSTTLFHPHNEDIHTFACSVCDPMSIKLVFIRAAGEQGGVVGGGLGGGALKAQKQWSVATIGGTGIWSV